MFPCFDGNLHNGLQTLRRKVNSDNRKRGAVASTDVSSMRCRVGARGTWENEPTTSNETKRLPGGEGVQKSVSVNSIEFFTEREDWKLVIHLSRISRYLVSLYVSEEIKDTASRIKKCFENVSISYRFANFCLLYSRRVLDHHMPWGSRPRHRLSTRVFCMSPSFCLHQGGGVGLFSETVVNLLAEASCIRAAWSASCGLKAMGHIIWAKST